MQERHSISDVTAYATQAFRLAGVRASQAQSAAEILVLAEAMGIGTHGLSRVRVYIDSIAAGGINPTARITATAPAPALCHIDGQNGLGPAVANHARLAAQKAARACGIGAAFVKGGNHLGALAPHLFLAAEAGFAAFVTTNTAPMIAPAGGREARIGNNPVGIAIPHPDGQHLLLDLALSVVARSRVRAAAESGQQIPESWATDVDGHPTTDPAKAMQGLMRAIGGDKGALLALGFDLMTGALSGSGILDEIPSKAAQPDKPQNLGQMIILIDVAHLSGAEPLGQRLDSAREILAATPGRDPSHPPRLPGERALAQLRDARENGLVLPRALLGEIRALAKP